MRITIVGSCLLSLLASACSGSSDANGCPIGPGGTTPGGTGGSSAIGDAGTSPRGGTGADAGAAATGGRAATGGATNGGAPAAGAAGSGGAGATLPTDASGYTVLTPSVDSQLIYVARDGDDANDGLSETAPVQTIARGVSLLRDGSPDHLLLRRGDVWQASFGGWSKSGRSAEEPMVISAYGEGERPRLEFEGAAITVTGAGGTPQVLRHLAFTSVHLFGVAHDPSRGVPTAATPTCMSWLRGAEDVLFEDMRFEYCQLDVQDPEGLGIRGMRFFRSLFLDSYSVTDAHAQGIYISGVSGMSIEECIFDRCGWHPDVAAATPTMFNHCIYWQTGGAPDGLVRDNIVLRGASHGAQMRSSGRVEGNVFAGNAIGAFLAGDYDVAPSGVQGYATGNLFTEGQDITPREGHSGEEYRGWAFQIIPGAAPLRNVVVSDNIVTHCRGTMCESLPASFDGSTIEDNIVWNWAAGSSGYVEPSTGPFVDPDRTLASYNAGLGGEATFDGFALEVRRQSKTNWRPAYTAPVIIDYFREGFAPGG